MGKPLPKAFGFRGKGRLSVLLKPGRPPKVELVGDVPVRTVTNIAAAKAAVENDFLAEGHRDF